MSAIVACACAFGVSACQGSSTTPQLADARRAYEDAEDSPAATYARAELLAARRALDRAETAHDADAGSDREAHLAYLAARKAEVARAHGEMAAAEHAKAAAKARADQHARLAREAQRGDRDTVAAVDRRRDVDRAAKADRDVDRDRDDLEPRGGMRDEQRAVAALQNLGQVANVKEEPRGIVVTLSGALLFPSGEEQLSPLARQNLDQVADALVRQPADKVFVIEGHTDNTGAERANEQLSLRRARAVANYLMQRQIDADRIRVVGRGESEPIAGNETPEGRSANRRIEIVIADQEDLR